MSLRIRKYLSGNEKKKKKRKEELLTQSLSGSLNKYFTSPKPSDGDSTNVANMVIDEEVDVNVNPNDSNEVVDIVDHDEQEGANNVNEEQEEEGAKNDIPLDHEEEGQPLDIYDPSNWKVPDQNLIDLLVRKGPLRVEMDDNEYPRDHSKRHFSNFHYTRGLKNGVKHNRRWLVYSKSVDKVFCFCCKLFKSIDEDTLLSSFGLRDWHNIASRLKSHESSKEHMLCMSKWTELETRLELNRTIDRSAQEQIMKEKERMKLVMFRIHGAITYLATHNLAFRGTNEKIYEEDNGNFLGLIEYVATIDPVMENHLQRVENKEHRHHYLSHKIQNEIIQSVANEVKNAIVKKIKKARYFSVILDCTPDVSHEEQMTLLIRCVNVDDSPIKVVEYFLGFIKVGDTTGLGLFSELVNALSKLGLNIDDIRGQGYDNGANMKGRCKGVQSRLLNVNPRAFYTPCCAHSLNLTLCDMARSSPKADAYFGSIQRLYNIFSSSTKRWDLLRRHVNGLTLKSLCHTRWESHIECVKPIMHQFLKIKEALTELTNSNDDSDATNGASLLATNEFESFEFLVSTMIWYEVLNAINVVSKTLQSENMHIDVAIDLLRGLIDFFRGYREYGFNDAMTKAKELAQEMDIEPVFHEKRTVRRKKFFDEVDDRLSEEVVLSPQERFKVEYFLFLVDKALVSLEERFEQFRVYEKKFGFLFDLKKSSKDAKSLKISCDNLSNLLTYNGNEDVDGDELLRELQLVTHILPPQVVRPIQILEYLRRCDQCFPNMEIAYQILLTIPVTVASGERSFSKLKLIKNHLRSTMTQERLNGLAMISIEKNMVDEIDKSTLIEDFISKSVGRATLK